MIYIVEIPHQRPPFAWAALDEFAVIGAIEKTNIRNGDVPEYGASFQDWLDYNATDLSKQYVFMNGADAIDGLEEINGHGSAAAIDALRKLLVEYGELEEL